MGKTLTEIAEQLKATDKKVQLIYAFNGTGKTRLSQEFKELVAPKNNDEDEEGEEGPEEPRIKIIYYSAFTQDLFYWDNDLDGDAKRKLKIQPNSFTKWVLEEQGQDQNVVATFQRYTNAKLTPRFNEEYKTNDKDGNEIIVKAFSEVTFSLATGDDDHLENLKISKAEENNFIWSIFYTLLDQVINTLNVVEPEIQEKSQFDQLEYVFIDDPVSSLDENHLIQLAISLGKLLRSSHFSGGNNGGLKFIVATHNPLFYNVLYNELQAKSGYILSALDDGSYELEEKEGDSNKSFSYHLHIKDLITRAVEGNSVQRYHFALLRNLYEKTANFLGYKRWSDLLPGDQKAYATRVMNFYPHNTLSNEEISEPTPPEKRMVSLLLSNLDNYGYWQQKNGESA